MRLSDHIAQFIVAALGAQDGVVELRRQELAEQFGCVPSQINYVIQTRFSPEHGFIVESRRGGGGYIRIRRVVCDGSALIMHTVNTIGEQIDTGSLVTILRNLRDAEVLSDREANLLLSATSDRALAEVSPDVRPAVRASIVKQSLVSLLR